MSSSRSEIQEKLERLNRGLTGIATPAADRVRGDLAAAIYHCGRGAGTVEAAISEAGTRPSARLPIIGIIGGTGTGKSTIVNRLLGSELSATSFRRTFTAGPVLITRDALPGGFAALIHMDADARPARGQSDRVTIIRSDEPILGELALVDTPDIDGELVEHHAVADRIFRWCDAIVFLVSPEKYQMPELQPYYRLAQRYVLPALYVMNKADSAAVVEDYEQLLVRTGTPSPTVLAVARDDATWQPDPSRTLDAATIRTLQINPSDAGLHARVADVVGRVNDQLLQPLLERRSRIDRIINHLNALTSDAVEMDVHPITQQLQRRMREKSVLYLIGPQRVLDRIRSVPSMIVRMPVALSSRPSSGPEAT
ncbi:MAG: GTPase domain-containing protein, partial [Burkholderiales bacterium]|nr:GTPase domain-containing protein [Phycisphaerae bacterium]